MAERTARRARTVGVDLQDNEDNRPIVEAIERDNPDVTLRRMPGMVKMQTATRVIIRGSTGGELPRRPWDTNEFQLAIISLSGNVVEWDEDEIIISWEH